jgi:hypothetical protein
MHSPELLVLEPSCFKVEIAIGKPKRYKSPGVDKIPTELIWSEDIDIDEKIMLRVDFKEIRWKGVD